MNRSYQKKIEREQCADYFRHYENSVRVIVFDKAVTPHPKIADTLLENAFVFHYTMNDTQFAATCIYKIVDTFITVTLPLGISGSEAAIVAPYYDRLLREGNDCPHYSKWGMFKENKWLIAAEKNRWRYQDISRPDKLEEKPPDAV